LQRIAEDLGTPAPQQALEIPRVPRMEEHGDAVEIARIQHRARHLNIPQMRYDQHGAAGVRHRLSKLRWIRRIDHARIDPRSPGAEALDRLGNESESVAQQIELVRGAALTPHRIGATQIFSRSSALLAAREVEAKPDG